MDFAKYKHKLLYVRDPEANAARREEERNLMVMFKQDLFIELDIENNPKREKLFSLAWANGHSYGYSEVYNQAIDLIDLIN